MKRQVACKNKNKNYYSSKHTFNMLMNINFAMKRSRHLIPEKRSDFFFPSLFSLLLKHYFQLLKAQHHISLGQRCTVGHYQLQVTERVVRYLANLVYQITSNQTDHSLTNFITFVMKVTRVYTHN